MAITASYDGISQDLTVTGDAAANVITVSRNAGGALLVNNGVVPVTGGTPSVANTDRIAVTGDLGNDTITLDETNGALPMADITGGGGDDALTGGAGADLLSGEAGIDTLLGRGGADILDGGADNDTLVGGDGDDQMLGGLGNDRMIWNPGDDTDLWEGGDGTDTGEVNGGGGAEVFTVTANGTRVRFDRIDPAPFSLDIGTTEALVLNAGGGDDTISTSGNLAALISLTLDGGAGNDTILGGNGLDLLLGGDGNDFVDGQQGNDTAFLGAGDDVFQWDPGDGNDTVEGQAGTDRLQFNASAANEILDLSANGARTLLTRNVGAISMDLNDVEAFTINALGGTDTIAVHDATGTDAAQVTIDLAGTIGGSAGDGSADAVTVDGSSAANAVTVTGAGTAFAVEGLSAVVSVLNSEGANDSLVINALAENDSLIATALAAGIVRLTLDGGAGNDTILASQGADTILAGDGNDAVLGDNGHDTAFLGAGDDVFVWTPGDGNDLVEGQAGTDELLFEGSNASETINVLANGGRVSFQRDVAAVLIDLDDVERIHFDALGGADNVVVGDLTGTDATLVEVALAATGGGGDGAVDTVTVNAGSAADTLTAASAGGVVTVSGLPWAVSLSGSDGVGDRLLLNGLGGDDVIDASGVAAGLVSLLVNGGLGGDVFIGSAGSDQFNGGDGNDTALLGAGNDTAVWNPGDDNDIVEGQGGMDTLQFNGANVAETITVSANGGRAAFFRDVANVTMDLNDTEVIRFAAVGGADTILVDDLSGTDVTQVVLDLAGALDGGAGDGAADAVTVRGSAASNTISLVGSSAAVTIAGLPWTVTISRIEAADGLTLFAGEGNDAISTGGIANGTAVLTLDGGGGSDTLQSTGDGTYLGGAGDDLVLAGLTSLSEVLDGGDGIDTLDTRTWGGLYSIDMITGVTNYSGESFINFENLITGEGDDTIAGTAAGNVIRTGGGADDVAAGAGNDTVEGGAGADVLDGGADVDTLSYGASLAGVAVSLAAASASGGDAGGDTISNFENLTGSNLADELTGNGLANVLNGLGGADVLRGGAGDDQFVVNGQGDTVVENAGEGIDTVYASASYTLAAGTEVEFLRTSAQTGTAAIDLTGNGFSQTVLGNNGANVLNGGNFGDDVLAGFAGNDSYVVNGQSDQVLEIVGQGTDTVFTSASYALAADAEIEVLRTSAQGATTAINLTGNGFSQTVLGNNGVNTLSGGSGGSDILAGFAGNDSYVVNSQSDQVLEAAGQGIDTVYASVSYVLANTEVEVLRTTSQAGIGAIDLTGNGFNQTIHGNNGINTLNGGNGDDILHGHAGNDSYVVNSQSDQVVESAGEGSDTVYTSASYALAAATEIEALRTTSQTATTAIDLTGNGFSQSVFGNNGANVLSGGSAGDDVLAGFAGNDSYVVNSQSDQVIETAGQGSDTVFTSVSYGLALGTEVEVLRTTSQGATSAINLVGNTIAQTIVGNAGANTIDGRGGNDTLHGLGGADSFAFRTALGAGNVDRIADYSVADDRILLDDAVFAGLALGALAAGAFNTGAAASQADDRIIYNSVTGALLFDADGNGAGAAVQFATLSAGLAMAASEFVVI